METLEQMITTVEIAEMMEIEHYKVLRKLEGREAIEIRRTIKHKRISISSEVTNLIYLSFGY